MKFTNERRRFLQSIATTAAGFGLAGLGGSRVMADPTTSADPHAEKLGWRLGCQAYTFRLFTFYEALEKNRALGLHTIEMFPNQTLSKENADVRTNDAMPPRLRKEVKKRLADAGTKLANYGVCPLNNHEDVCRKTFDFAKDMGIETLVSEPPFDALDLVERLADEYQINVAFHNHPEPSRYWNPDTVLEHTKGRSKRLGACADTGHWMRSGINPVEAIRKLEGRIICFHFKDLNKYGRKDSHDVPWGTGQADVAAMLAEIHRQHFKGVFSIEYEYNWENSVPEIAQSVAYFDKVASQWAS